MSPRPIRVGTRGSALALWQANWVVEQLCAVAPGRGCEVTIIRTEGDRRQDVPLAAVGAQGVFVAELEEALVDGRVDLAVHSSKDLPTVLHPALTLGAFLPREDAHDVLVSLKHKSLASLPDGSRIGTGSARRIAQLSHFNRSFRFEEVRGNLDTRLAKLERQDLDAIVLAAAGLMRLGWGDRITERLSMAICLPAVGQGAVAIELPKDSELAEIILKLDHAPTRAAVLAERAVLRSLQGGCSAPIGAHAVVVSDYLQLTGTVAAVDGSVLLRKTMEGPMAKPDELGVALAEELRTLGAEALLGAVRSR